MSVKGMSIVAEGKRVSGCPAGETPFQTHPTVHVLTTGIPRDPAIHGNWTDVRQ
jgi:hypothetical protein